MGGTTVDIKYSTNNLVYAQGRHGIPAAVGLHRRRGVVRARPRALLHQGVQSSLTEEKRRWLNAHYQSEARVPAQHAFNPDTQFDAACLGGGTEDVLPAWPYRGNWTTKYGAILSMYMLAEALDVDPILARYGGITYRLAETPADDWVGALETVDRVRAWRSDGAVTIQARNMIPAAARYNRPRAGRGRQPRGGCRRRLRAGRRRGSSGYRCPRSAADAPPSMVGSAGIAQTPMEETL